MSHPSHSARNLASEDPRISVRARRRFSCFSGTHCRYTSFATCHTGAQCERRMQARGRARAAAHRAADVIRVIVRRAQRRVDDHGTSARPRQRLLDGHELAVDDRELDGASSAGPLEAAHVSSPRRQEDEAAVLHVGVDGHELRTAVGQHELLTCHAQHSARSAVWGVGCEVSSMG